MSGIITDLKKLLPEEVEDAFKVLISKIEKGELKFFVIRELFTNFNRFKVKISEALPKSNEKIKVGDIPALRAMYQHDSTCLEESLQNMVNKGILSSKMMSDIKKLRKE